MMKQKNANVNMENVNKLADVLKQLNSGVNPQLARKNTLELVKNINPVELSLAEQKLIEEGLKPEDLRSLCAIHMEVLQDELTRLKSKVEPGHPLDTFISEHEQLLNFLTTLDEINTVLQGRYSYSPDIKEYEGLKAVARLLVGAENHHLREENVLFPELEKKGVTGPTRIMRMEHDDIRARKRRIVELADNVENMDYSSFKKELDTNVGCLVFNLRDHIYKENHILYPSAFETLQGKGIWEQMKIKCDGIGYCSFTPSH